MRSKILSFGVPAIAAVASMLLGACAGSSAETTAPGSSTSQASVAPAEPSALSGTWAFVLTASDVAAPLRERCAKSTNGDAAKADACFQEVADQAAREKIRFASDASGATVWTSFETDGAKESIYVQVPVQLTADGPGHVLAKVSGAPKGDHAAQFAKSSTNVVRIEMVDAKTIAVSDPKKGRLVYTKE